MGAQVTTVADQLAWSALDEETKRIARAVLREEVRDEVESEIISWQTHETRRLTDEAETLEGIIITFLNAYDGTDKEELRAATEALREAVE